MDAGYAGNARAAAQTSTRRLYHRPPASYATFFKQTLGSPHSMHTDMDAAMEFDALQVMARKAPPKGLAKELTAPDLVNHLTKAMAMAAAEVIDGLARPPPVTDATDAALRERFLQRRAAAQHSGTTSTATSRVLVFDQLAHRQQTPKKEDPWQTRPEMMPRKVTEHGRQPERGQEPGRSTSWVVQESGLSTSQKRRSQSHPRDEADSKKGHTEEGATRKKVQVGIDWANTGIQNLVSKPDPQHPSFKPDPSGATDSPPPPRVKSSVSMRGSHRSSSQMIGCRTATPASQGSRTESNKTGTSKTEVKATGLGPTRYPGDPEKREVKDKSYDWIARRMAQLDPKGFVEEINSFRYFDRNSKTFAFEVIALADWGRRYIELGFNYPIPVFPNYLFNQLSKSCQVVGQPSLKLDSIQQLGDDVWARCTEAWTLMTSVLQFWTDEESIRDGAIFGSWIRLVSALAEYMLNTINPHLEEGYKVTWDEVVHHTPWIRKRLMGDSALVKQIQRQPIPLEGHSSELEMAMEEYYNRELRCLETPMQGATKDKAVSKTITGLSRGQDLKLHLRRSMPGDGWSHVQPKDPGPDVGKKYKQPREEEPTPQDEPWWRKSDDDTTFLCDEPQPQEGAGRSP